MSNPNKSFGKQLKDYVTANGDVVKGPHGIIAVITPVVISLLIGLVGRGVLPGGEFVFHVSFYVMACVLAVAAVIALGDKRHATGNEDVAPTFALGAIVLTMGLAALSCFKDLGAFQIVLGS